MSLALTVWLLMCIRKASQLTLELSRLIVGSILSAISGTTASLKTQLLASSCVDRINS